MPSARRIGTVAASPQAVWEIIEDPHHLPRWWPDVARAEGVEPDRWTLVFTTQKGRQVRADFRLLESHPPRLRSWEQEIAGTPFERVLNESIIEIALDPVDGGTQVTIAQRQKLRGYSRTGGILLRRATARKLDQALDGLTRICGSPATD
jgi:uncharacterized protein YndB with AHSA1/START domain